MIGVLKMKKNKLKYKVDDLVMIYKETPTYFEGGLAKIVDFTSADRTYLVGDLDLVLRTNGDINRVMDNAKWVAEENLELVTFERPTFKKAFASFIEAFKRLFKKS